MARATDKAGAQDGGKPCCILEDSGWGGSLSPTPVTLARREVLLVDSRPEFKSFELTDDDDAVVIACDGVWDVLSEREAPSAATTSSQSWFLG